MPFSDYFFWNYLNELITFACVYKIAIFWGKKSKKWERKLKKKLISLRENPFFKIFGLIRIN